MAANCDRIGEQAVDHKSNFDQSGLSLLRIPSGNLWRTLSLALRLAVRGKKTRLTPPAARGYSLGMRKLADRLRAWRWPARSLFFLWGVAVVCAEDPGRTRPWEDYHTIMWVGDTAYREPGKLPRFFQRLREMGVNTAMVYGEGEARPLLENRFAYYVENMINRGLCLKFNSKVRDWDQFVTNWAQSGRPEAGLVRDYCLDNAQWRQWAREQVQRIVRTHRGHEPLAYNLRDELSTTISANPFDYDYNPIALADSASGSRPNIPAWRPSTANGKPALTRGRRSSPSPPTRSRTGWRVARPCLAERRTGSGCRRSSSIRLQRVYPGRDGTSRPGPTFEPIWTCRWPGVDELRQAARELDPRTPVGIEGVIKRVSIIVNVGCDRAGLWYDASALWQLDVGGCGEKVPT